MVFIVHFLLGLLLVMDGAVRYQQDSVPHQWSPPMETLHHNVTLVPPPGGEVGGASPVLPYWVLAPTEESDSVKPQLSLPTEGSRLSELQPPSYTEQPSLPKPQPTSYTEQPGFQKPESSSYTIYWWENAPYTTKPEVSVNLLQNTQVSLNASAFSGMFLTIVTGIIERCNPFLRLTKSEDLSASGNDVPGNDENLKWHFVLVPNQLDLLAQISTYQTKQTGNGPHSPDRISADRNRNRNRNQKGLPTLFLPYTSRAPTSASGGPGEHALWFVPVVDSPGAALFYRKELQPPPASDLSDVIKQAWPLVLLIFLGAGYSGIIVWLLDRLWNPGNFPKPFIRGFWEGFWWAFVTMTTVGYGDTTPRSIQARLFGLFWIMVGITIVSFFTATVTSIFTPSPLTVPVFLHGQKVGVLNGSEEYSLAVSLGADVTVWNSFEELVASMDAGYVKAAIVDHFVFAVHQEKLTDNYLLDRIYPHPVSHGLLLRDSSLALRRCVMTYLLETRLLHLSLLSA